MVLRKIGPPPIMVIVNKGIINPSIILRARVYLDVNVPLVRFVSIYKEKSIRLHREKKCKTIWSMFECGKDWIIIVVKKKY